MIGSENLFNFLFPGTTAAKWKLYFELFISKMSLKKKLKAGDPEKRTYQDSEHGCGCRQHP
jgi:hypothetical protein